jgi:hypothetical protein
MPQEPRLEMLPDKDLKLTGSHFRKVVRRIESIVPLAGEGITVEPVDGGIKINNDSPAAIWRMWIYCSRIWRALSVRCSKCMFKWNPGCGLCIAIKKRCIGWRGFPLRDIGKSKVTRGLDYGKQH